jgi:hypothetical protein
MEKRTASQSQPGTPQGATKYVLLPKEAALAITAEVIAKYRPALEEMAK